MPDRRPNPADDDGVGFDRDECECAYRDPVEQELGERSLAWTKARTTPANKEFLRTLRPRVHLEADGKRLLLVRGSPGKMNEYLVEDRPVSSFDRLRRGNSCGGDSCDGTPPRICVGH